MDRRLARIEDSRINVVSLCGKLQWLFAVLFALYCVGVAAVVFYSVFQPAGFTYTGPTVALALLPVACNVVAGGITIYALGRMLRSVGAGRTPFTDSSSRWLVVLAIVLLASVVSEALIAPGTVVGAVDGASAMAFEYGAGAGGAVHVDLKSLFASIACFVLAVVFKYGVALQDETDDLV